MLRVISYAGNAYLFLMRWIVVGLGFLLVVAGCEPARFPTPEQNRAAIEASWNDKKERIVPDVLAGMWIGDKGSVLSFGPEHNISYRVGVNGKTIQGKYKLEGFHLLMDQQALGYITMSKPDKFFLAKTREDLENFRKFAG